MLMDSISKLGVVLGFLGVFFAARDVEPAGILILLKLS